MGTYKTGSSSGRSRPNAAERLAAQREAAARQRRGAERRRKRLLVVGAPIMAVCLVIAVFVAVKLAGGSVAPKPGLPATAAGNITAQLAAVPQAVLDEVGVGNIVSKPVAVSAPALTSDGKPAVLYIGAEYCPYCAAQRWAVVVALSRFGQFANLGQTASSPSDVYPSTPTLTFHGATYTSRYLSFNAKEVQSNQVVNGQYAPLDTLTAQEQSLMATYDAPPYVDSSGSIPFIDLAGKRVVSGATYSPQVLQGMTQDQIASAVSDAASPVAKAIDGSANLLTATLCAATGQQPASACATTGVKAASAALSAGK